MNPKDQSPELNRLAHRYRAQLERERNIALGAVFLIFTALIVGFVIGFIVAR